MPATTTTSSMEVPSGLPTSDRTTPWRLRQRVAALVSSAVAAVLGVLPHVLHHAGPLAGAALLAGTGGTLLFGVIGLVAAIPFLVRLHRRRGNWRVPAALLTLFAIIFSISTFVVAPVITGGEKSGSVTNRTGTGTPSMTEHEAHHR